MKFLLFFTILIPCILGCAKTDGIAVEVTNPLPNDREGEIIAISLTDLYAHGLKDPTKIIVTDSRNEQQVIQQITYDSLLIFPVNVPAKGSSKYIIGEGQSEEFPARTYGRLVPERKDDICWENDRIAYRTYGPALEATGEINNGNDIWVKRTSELIIDHRYALELGPETQAELARLNKIDKQAAKAFRDSTSYHIDHGNGLDCYSVGRTLGAGAMAPYVNDTLWLANNFTQAEVLDNGPLRFTCKLAYAPFNVNGQKISEQRLISLDAGTHFNRTTVTYEGAPDQMPVAAGIVLHGTDDYMMAPEAGFICYNDPPTKKDGQTYIAVLFPQGQWETKIGCNHLLAISTYSSDQGITYYWGAGWSKFGFATSAEWKQYAQRQAKLLRTPLQVRLK